MPGVCFCRSCCIGSSILSMTSVITWKLGSTMKSMKPAQHPESSSLAHRYIVILFRSRSYIKANGSSQSQDHRSKKMLSLCPVQVQNLQRLDTDRSFFVRRYVRNIQDNFVYQGHQVKVKVTGGCNKAPLCIPFGNGLSLIKMQSFWLCNFNNL